MTDPQLGLDAITATPRAEDIPVLAAEVRRLRTEMAVPAAPGSLRAAYIAALDEAHHTHPCPVTGSPYWTGCFHPDGQGASCHSRRRADAVLAVRDTELERLRAQNRHLIGQLAEKATHSDDDHALLEFPGADGTVDLAAADNPTQLRWGLGDVLWSDDDTVTVLLSGPRGEPYWLELGEERAAALQQDLALSGQDEMADGLSTDLAESKQVVDEEHNNASSRTPHMATPGLPAGASPCPDPEPPNALRVRGRRPFVRTAAGPCASCPYPGECRRAGRAPPHTTVRPPLASASPEGRGEITRTNTPIKEDER